MWTLLVVLARAKDVRPPQKLENTSGEHLRHCLEHTRNSSQTGMADALSRPPFISNLLKNFSRTDLRLGKDIIAILIPDITWRALLFATTLSMHQSMQTQDPDHTERDQNPRRKNA